jgi:type VI secretion system FHA domain protein
MRLILTLFDPTALMGGPTVSRSFDRTGGTIGRADDNDWVLPDPGHHLSDQHCRIEYRDDGYTLIDTSTTGVYVNESTEALGFGNAKALGAGDRIALGDYLLAVALDDGTAPIAAPTTAEKPSEAPTGGTPFVVPTREPSPTAAPTGAAAPPQPAAPPVPPPRPRPEDRLPSSDRPTARAPADEPSDVLTLDLPLPRGVRADRVFRPASRRTPRPDDGAARAGDGRVNEFVSAFLGGAGVAASELSRDQAIQLMTRAGAALREAVGGMHEVLRARAGVRRGGRLDASRLGTSADNPLTDAADTDQAVANLLGLTRPSRLPPERAIREVIAEIKSHGPAARAAWARPGRIALAVVGALVVLAAAAAYHEFGPGGRTVTLPPTQVARVDATPPVSPEPPPAPVAATPPAAPPAAPPPPAPVAATPPPAPSPPAPPTPAIANAPAAPTPTPAIDRTRLRGALSELFRSFACANLDAEIGDDGTVILTGFVSRGDELTRLHREVSALPHVPRVDSRAIVEPWPFCEVGRLLSTQTAGGPTAPQIEASNADRTYREGDALLVTATNHANEDSYLYVDFFDTDGKVVHMLPTALRANNRVAANQRVALGAVPGKAGRNERIYVISPPFGTGMVIALSSTKPLFAELRPEQEDAGAYLAALAGALVRDPVGSGRAARVTSSQQSITLVAR